MSFERDHRNATQAQTSNDEDDVAPGRASPAARLDAPDTPIASGLLEPVQLARDGHTGLDDAGVQAAAAHGISGGSQQLPHLDAIQRSFGPHDVSGVTAHVGGAAAEASRAIGARAYASGNHVAFAESPSLSLAAHEAAHVVQQRAGVHLSSAVGQVGDAYEQNADAVAERVVRGESAVDLLGPTSEVAGNAVQRSTVQRDAAPSAKPHSYSEHVAAPALFDFGKISPGGFAQTEGAMFNMSSAQCAVQVSYSGSPVIHLVRQPTRLAAKGETWSAADQTIKLQFNAPATKGTHRGTVTVHVQWWGGPPADTLTIPVVAHALDPSDDSPDEKIAREQRTKQAAEEAARIAKRNAKKEKDLEAFEEKHPKVGTDEFERQKEALWRVVSQFEQMQLSGVATAHDEVMKYVKRPPPTQDTRVFDLAMLVLDIVSAGIAGKLGRALDVGLRSAGNDLAVKMGKQIVLSDSTVSMITDSVKESLKGSSKLARKLGLTPKGPKSGPAVGGDPTPAPGESADPRIAFFQHQRNGFVHGESTRTAGVNRALRLLMPSLHAKPELAYAALKQMTAAYAGLLADTTNTVAHESVRQWINVIADERLDVHHAGSVGSKPINEIDGVIDIGFQSPSGPRSPTVVKQAIIRGVSNAVAHRFQNIRLGDTAVPIRAYGLPGGNYAELPVAILYKSPSQIDWADKTNGLAPPSAATWIRQKGGAKHFMESEILNKSLTQHGVVLTTDQDPKLEGG